MIGATAFPACGKGHADYCVLGLPGVNSAVGFYSVPAGRLIEDLAGGSVVPDDRADAEPPAAPEQTACLGCGQPVPPEDLVCPRCTRAAHDNATGRPAWRPRPRKPFQFGLSTLFLVMLAGGAGTGLGDCAAAVDLTFEYVAFSADGDPGIFYRVTRRSGCGAASSGREFTDNGKPSAQNHCSAQWVFNAPFGECTPDSSSCKMWVIIPHAPSLGIAPPWQDPVWLVRPGETYRVTPSHPLRLLRYVEGQGNVTYAWMYLAPVPVSNASVVCPTPVGPPGAAPGGPSPASGKASNGSTIGK